MPELMIASIWSSNSFTLRFLFLAISVSGIFWSVFCIIYTLLVDLFTSDFITKSSGRVMSFSVTNLAIISTNFFPNFLAFPSPTPNMFFNSSKLIGYWRAISSKEGSWKIANGGILFCWATFFRNVFKRLNRFLSKPPLLVGTDRAFSSSSMLS